MPSSASRFVLASILGVLLSVPLLAGAAAVLPGAEDCTQISRWIFWGRQACYTRNLKAGFNEYGTVVEKSSIAPGASATPAQPAPSVPDNSAQKGDYTGAQYVGTGDKESGYVRPTIPGAIEDVNEANVRSRATDRNTITNPLPADQAYSQSRTQDRALYNTENSQPRSVIEVVTPKATTKNAASLPNYVQIDKSCWNTAQDNITAYKDCMRRDYFDAYAKAYKEATPAATQKAPYDYSKVNPWNVSESAQKICDAIATGPGFKVGDYRQCLTNPEDFKSLLAEPIRIDAKQIEQREFDASLSGRPWDGETSEGSYDTRSNQRLEISDFDVGDAGLPPNTRGAAGPAATPRSPTEPSGPYPYSSNETGVQPYPESGGTYNPVSAFGNWVGSLFRTEPRALNERLVTPAPAAPAEQPSVAPYYEVQTPTGVSEVSPAIYPEQAQTGGGFGDWFSTIGRSIRDFVGSGKNPEYPPSPNETESYGGVPPAYEPVLEGNAPGAENYVPVDVAPVDTFNPNRKYPDGTYQGTPIEGYNDDEFGRAVESYVNENAPAVVAPEYVPPHEQWGYTPTQWDVRITPFTPGEDTVGPELDFSEFWDNFIYNGEGRQYSMAVPFSDTLFNQSLAASAFGAFLLNDK